MAQKTSSRRRIRASTVSTLSLTVLIESSFLAARGVEAEPDRCAAVPAKSEWQVSADRAEVMVSDEGGQLALLVTNPRGIGSVTLSCGKEPLTKKIHLRLRYAPGRPFQDLEGITVELGERTLSARHTPGRGDFSAAAKDSPALKFRMTADYLEVEIPCDRQTNNGPISLRWVDYYR